MCLVLQLTILVLCMVDTPKIVAITEKKLDQTDCIQYNKKDLQYHPVLYCQVYNSGSISEP